MNIKYISLLSQTHYASLMEMNHPYTIVQCPGTQQFFPQQKFPLVSHLIASYVGASDINIGHYIW
jgi:hypothetical protein